MAIGKNSQRMRAAIQNVARLFGEPARQWGTSGDLDYKAPVDVPALATGFRPLDKALGIGGLPQGHITELLEPGINAISNGATTIAARIAAKVQRQQQIVAIIDMNHSFDGWHAEQCGLIAPNLLVTRPDTVLATLNAIEKAARNATLVIVMMGVVSKLLQHVEPALLATLLRRLQRIIKKSPSVFLLVTAPPKNEPFSPDNYPEGFPLAEIADVRLWLQDEAWSYKDGLATTYKANLTVIKNNLATPGKGADIKVKLNSFP
jgi:hypothetical protein